MSECEQHPSEIMTFRAAMLPVFVALYFPFTILILMWLALVQRIEINQDVVLAVYLYLLPIAFLLSLGTFLTPYKVWPQGIYCCTLWGRRCLMPWEEIYKVRKYWALNLRYLKVFSHGRRPVYLPMFMARQREFERAILRLAPPGHPTLAELK